MLTLYHVDLLPNIGYPMELAGVQDILVLSTKQKKTAKD